MHCCVKCGVVKACEEGLQLLQCFQAHMSEPRMVAASLTALIQFKTLSWTREGLGPGTFVFKVRVQQSFAFKSVCQRTYVPMHVSQCMCVYTHEGRTKDNPPKLIIFTFVGFSTQDPAHHHGQVTGCGSHPLSVFIGTTQEDCLRRAYEDKSERQAAFDDRGKKQLQGSSKVGASQATHVCDPRGVSPWLLLTSRDLQYTGMPFHLLYLCCPVLEAIRN